MKLKHNEYHAFLRRDLYAFAQRCFYELNPNTKFLPNWHIEVAASALDGCRRGGIARLIINQPPRSLKSHLASVSFPAFVLGHDPSAKIICVSYSQDLSNRLAMDCRTILNSAWYRALFPNAQLSFERQALQELVTTQHGYRLATSVGGVLTGRGADYIIIDDPLKAEEGFSEALRKAVNEWYDHTLLTRLNDKRTGRIILVMQRLHEDDLVGHVVSTEPWQLIRFPAIAEGPETLVIQTPFGVRRFKREVGQALHPERESLEVLNHLRGTIGEYNFAGQYSKRRPLWAGDS